MCITDKYGYNFYINQYNKVVYILVHKHNGVEKLYPYKWDHKINDIMYKWGDINEND